MRASETAKEFLRKRFEPRFPRLRGEEPGGNWIDIRCFGLPVNEHMPDGCRLAPARSTNEE